MNLLNRVKKIPGGLLIIPMSIAAVINTFFPDIFRIGDPTTALFTSKGTMVLIGLILLVSGSQFNVAQIPITLKRAGVLCLAKLIISWTAGFLFIRFFGLDGILEISAVAFVAVISSCNPGLYLALMYAYGDAADCGAFGILNLIAVPILPVMILNMSSGLEISYLSVLATLLPFGLGMLLGNLDANIQKMFSTGTAILLPFLGMNFGSNIDLRLALQSGLAGLLLTLTFMIVSMLPLILAEKLVLRRPGYGAAAASSVAAMSLVVPALAAGINPIYAPYVEPAIAQIALAVVLTSMITPYCTQKMAGKS